MLWSQHKINILIAAGGTGGHIIPAKQLAHRLQNLPECASVLFMGNGFQKAAYFKEEGFSFLEIPSASIRKKSIYAIIKALFMLVISTIKCLLILRNKKMDIVVGFGSYHAFPVLLAALLLRKPIVLFESNCILGRVNKFFARKCRFLALQFPLYSSLPKSSIFVEPLPWVKMDHSLPKNSAIKMLGLQEDLFTFLIFGGSQGAIFINQLFLETAKQLKDKQKIFQVIHLAGSSDIAEKIESTYKNLDTRCYVRSFEKEMAKLYSASDLVICRAGAATLSELIYFEKPALLIPYPHAAENHQEENARFFTKEVKGGSYLVQKEITPLNFLHEIERLQNPETLAVFQKGIISYKENEQNKKKERLEELIFKAVQR